MVYLFYIIFNSVDLAHYELFLFAQVGKVGIRGVYEREIELHLQSNLSLLDTCIFDTLFDDSKHTVHV